MRFNVFLGHDKMTFKGDKHLVEHNTGDRLNMVEAWGAIDDHNTQTWSRYNAVPDFASRGSTSANGAVPGFASLNACSNLLKCNPGNSSLPRWAAAQFQLGGPKQLGPDICSELVACHPKKTNTYEAQRSSLDSTQPSKAEQPLKHREVRELDFHPSPSSTALVLKCGDDTGCTGDGLVQGFGSEGQPQGWSQYIGTYRPGGGEPWVPGCWKTGCRRVVFPVPTPQGIPSMAPAEESSVSVPTPQGRPPMPPAEVSSVSVSMTMMNVDYQQLSADDKHELKGKIQDVLAESAGVDQAAVSVTLTPGSVKVDAEIQTPDANSAKSLEKSMNTNNIAENVVEAANSIPGVKAAATGELKVTGLEVKTAVRTAKGSVPLTTAMPQTETGAPASTTSFRSVVSTTALEGDAALSDSASGSSYLGIAEAWCILVATAVINWFNW